MGNWRTVHVTGTCAAAEVPTLRDALAAKNSAGDYVYDKWGPLAISEGLCALGDWPAERISRTGNLFERDYSPEDVADHLRKVCHLAPSLSLKVECGGEWESEDIVAVVICEAGEVRVEPATGRLPLIPPEQMMGNLLKALER